MSPHRYPLLERTCTGREVIASIQARIDALLVQRSPVEVLEAGCGSASMFSFPPHARLVGIDLSSEQLARNTRLDEAIQGDLCSYPLPPERFDLVVCWNVLEHLDQPDLAMQRFATTLKPGGLIVLALPNVYSFQGAVTRFTPHAFHVWFVRNVFRREWAGKEGRGPFPTYLRRAVSPPGLQGLAQQLGLEVEWSHLYEGGQQQRLMRLVPVSRPFFRSLDLLEVLSRGSIRPRLAATAWVLSRPPANNPTA